MSERPGTNWAGNVRFGAARMVRPRSVAQIQELVRGAERIRAVGTGHSFSPIADTTGDLVSVAGLPTRLEVADDRRSVTVSAGMRYGEIATRLQTAGLALHNLASLPHLSVAGAVATGTHGSGVGNASLAAAVTGLEMVTGGGDLVRLTRDADTERFPGAVVALGCLGIVTSMTLEVEPTYDVAQTVYLDLPFERAVDELDAIMSASYSVSLFTTWGDRVVDQVWLKRRTNEAPPTPGQWWLGARRATVACHPVPGTSADGCTMQLGVAGPWHERLPHFRLDHTPSAGTELQTEYLVPRPFGAQALRAVYEVRRSISPVLQVSEVRTVAADDLWLSPAEGIDSLGLHCTWIDDMAAVLPAVAILEAALAPFQARPHWGKVFTLAPERVRALYPRLSDFLALRRACDPGDVFGSSWADRYLGR